MEIKSKRLKIMPISEFTEVLKRKWYPVQLVGDSIPSFLSGIPEEVCNSVYASGDINYPIKYSQQLIIPSSDLIGGIDVYRNAPDDPVELNKDWYPCIKMPNNISYLIVAGPVKDPEHWLDKIPERLIGAEILGVPKK